MKILPISLHGKVVRLEPLTEMHVPDLALVGKDTSIWRYLPYGELTSEESMLSHVRWLLWRAVQGIDLPFAAIYQDTNRAIGCTRFLDIESDHKKLAIGGTWYGAACQRTKVNTECKYLLLTHAFEVLGCIRVQFKTDAHNIR